MGKGNGGTVPSPAHIDVGMTHDTFKTTENNVNRDEKEGEKLQKAFSAKLWNLDCIHQTGCKDVCWYRQKF